MKTRRLLIDCLSSVLLCSVAYAGGPAPSNTIQVVTAPVAVTAATNVVVTPTGHGHGDGDDRASTTGR